MLCYNFPHSLEEIAGIRSQGLTAPARNICYRNHIDLLVGKMQFCQFKRKHGAGTALRRIVDSAFCEQQPHIKTRGTINRLAYTRMFRIYLPLEVA